MSDVELPKPWDSPPPPEVQAHRDEAHSGQPCDCWAKAARRIYAEER